MLKPEGEPRTTRAMGEPERTIAGKSAGEPQARMPALLSARWWFEVDGRVCRQLIRPLRWRLQANVG